MGKGRFLNQKLGKRTSRRLDLLKSRFRTTQSTHQPQAPPEAKFPKKGPSRDTGNSGM
jgi:hypothetical protein